MATVKLRVGGLTREKIASTIESLKQQHNASIVKEVPAKMNYFGASNPEFTVQMDDAGVGKLLSHAGIVMGSCSGRQE